MKFFSEQNQLINILQILLLIFFVNILLIGNSGCGSTLNQKKYNECIPKLEEERQKVRVGNGFSYKAQTYEECRAPARYRLDSD
ncbi:MAG: hypothetical protein Ct9H300mP28_06560 [Pseudomonadota bacterium]|nr:MAG: hypothetical protein Ct9H300mP28_06560 [Pseudomonadota bacterium]